MQLSYAITVWGGCATKDKLKPLFLPQKRALRNLFGIKRESKFMPGHTKNVFKEHGILTVYNVYNYMTILNIGKLFMLGEPTFLCHILKLNANLKLRNNRLYVPAFKCVHYKNNFCYQAPIIWNTLASSSIISNNITKAPTINSLKSRVKKFLLQMQSYGINENDLEWYNSNKSVTTYLSAVKHKRNP